MTTVAVERIEGPTPSGGAYALAFFCEDNQLEAERMEATKVVVTEFDRDGAETWAMLPSG